MHDDEDHLEAWDLMPPVGREWGAPDAETLWALDALADRLRGTGMDLREIEGRWRLAWRGRKLTQWPVEETDWRVLRAAVVAVGDLEAVAVWDAATVNPR